MQRHHCGGDFGIPVETISKHHYISRYCKVGWVKEYGLQGKVVDDELLIKASIIFYASTWTIPKGSLFDICDHLRLPYLPMSPAHENDFSRVVQCRLSHLGTSQCYCADCVPRLRKCAYCAIEYDFAAVQAPASVLGRRRAPTHIYFEVWANLGTGESPRDPKRTNPEDSLLAQPMNSKLGSIRARYARG